MIVLDTHAVIWLTTDRGLGRHSQRIADKALSEDRLAISSISFWELAMLVAKGRLRAVAEKLCGGSLTPLLSHLVRARRLTARERQELRALIDELDRKPRPPGGQR